MRFKRKIDNSYLEHLGYEIKDGSHPYAVRADNRLIECSILVLQISLDDAAGQPKPGCVTIWWTPLFSSVLVDSFHFIPCDSTK
jgi:hypothetical protein